MANKDFFLSPDDAQTLGNINYMRKSVRVKHTFPKTLKNPNGFSIEKEVSSSDDRTVNGFDSNFSTTTNSSFSTPTVQPVQNTTNNANNTSSTPVENTPKKRPQGTSMDMFRNMARNIGKK